MPYYVHDKTIESFVTKLDNYDLDRRSFPSFANRVDARAKCPADCTVTYCADSAEWDVVLSRYRRRLEDGLTYRTPWDSRHWPNKHIHLVHCAFDSPGMVFYFQSEEHGHQNRVTGTKPGRFLDKYLRDYLTPEEIAEHVKSVTADVHTLKITSDADEIEKIYTGKSCGFSSCMQSKKEMEYDWQKHFENGTARHPAVVYAGPDLAVAYRGDLESVKQRAVVWPDEKKYVRIYGDGPLSALLARAGYTRTNSLDGARIQRIPHARGGYLMPYVDGSDTADLCSEYFRLGEGSYPAQNTNGRTEEEDETEECTNCAGQFRPDDLNNGICESCDSEQWVCENCESSYFDGDSAYCMYDGSSWCYSCWRNARKRCNEDGCNCQWIEEEQFSAVEIRDRAAEGLADYCAVCAAERRRVADALDTETETEETNDSPF